MAYFSILEKDIEKPLENHIYVNIEGTAKPFNIQRENQKMRELPG